MRWTLVQMLRAKGIATVEAESVKQAISILQNDPIDLIISDIQMPGEDGFELLKTLRASPQSQPPLIFMSGGLHLEAHTLKALGAVDFLPKPFGPQALLNSIRLVFSNVA